MAQTLNITPDESIQQNLNQWCYEVGTHYEDYSKLAAKRFIEYIKKQPVVDLGSGDGAATSVFIKNGNPTTAVDINQSKLDKIDKQATKVCKDALSYLQYIKLGNIFCHHALEHMVNYQDILDVIGQNLQKGKYCYIAVPKGDHPHEVHHVAFESAEELIPPGLEVIELGESDDTSWPEYYMIARQPWTGAKSSLISTTPTGRKWYTT